MLLAASPSGAKPGVIQCGLAAAIALIGLLSFTASFSQAIARFNPGFALRLAPYNAVALAAVAERNLAAAIKSPSDRASMVASARDYARNALLRDATNVSALVTYGLSQDLAGRPARARAILRHAQTLSRRNLPSQLWLIEDAVARGDVSGALDVYDIALRTSRTAPTLLFPILRAALSDAPIRYALVTVLKRNPSWAPQFLYQAGTQGPDYGAAGELFLEMRRNGLAVPPSGSDGVVLALANDSQFDRAWEIFGINGRAGGRRQVRNGNFGPSGPTATYFDWGFTDAAGLFGRLANDRQGGLLTFQATSGNGGWIAQQLQLLPPGRYLLSGVAEGVRLGGGVAPAWTLTCFQGGEVAHFAISANAGGSKPFGGVFTVGSDCRAQWLRLIVEPGDNTEAIEGGIRRIAIKPLS